MGPATGASPPREQKVLIVKGFTSPRPHFRPLSWGVLRRVEDAVSKTGMGNDPSAGSPTETLLRLLLPLNDSVWATFQLEVVVANLLEPVRRPH
jgi:hypothetical protein